MNILLLNAGSSSLKGTLMESTHAQVVARGVADWAGSATRYQYESSNNKHRSEDVSWKGHAQAVHRFISDLMQDEAIVVSVRSSLGAVGHRVVHGGQFSCSVRVTPQIHSRITALADLAPLHNPPSLETLAAAETELPGVPQVAVFDTAFHATLPPEAHTYPVPHRWTRDWGIRRFGFHGLSHDYCARRAAELLGRPLNALRLVICHLGHGCSASAVQGGRCVDTTMGFTPLEGLMMATRSGSIDPGIVLHVQQHHGLTAQQVETALNCESGLLGVSGISGDMRQVLAAARSGHEPARLALAVYSHRVRQAVGSLAVTMGGIDALVFTAGVGEHASEVRASICSGLECLGLEIDEQANATCAPDADVARPGSPGRILIIATREETTMLREVVQVLGEVPQEKM
jgi:acetate kinase